mmetsp:Transcript_27095/g.42077  ORF Transcript_27095/g.42077 Transcript_27095/m.42077 type:complete len:876 (-) Transcript_27095:211-2838(-)
MNRTRQNKRETKNGASAQAVHASEILVEDTEGFTQFSDDFENDEYIPLQARAKRRLPFRLSSSSSQRQSSIQDDEIGQTRYPTELHALCSVSDPDPIQLQSAFHANPNSAFARAGISDGHMYPVHLLLQNPEAVLRDQRLFDFCIELICTNPPALLLREIGGSGELIFLAPAWRWVQKSKRRGSAKGKKEWKHALNNVRDTVFRANSRRDCDNSEADGNMKIVHASPVQISRAVELILRILSRLIDNPVECDKMAWGRGIKSPELTVDEILEFVIVSLTSIQGFLKTSIFIANDRFREIFDLSVMKHVLLEKDSHGEWINELPEYCPHRIVLYFNEISKLLTDDINGLIPSTVQVIDVAEADFRRASITVRSHQSIRSKKAQKRRSISTILRALTESNVENTDLGVSGFAGIMTEKRDKIIDYLNYELLILSSVRRLNDTHQLQAGSTRLIRRIVDTKTAQAFCSCLTVLDATSHCIFFLAFFTQAAVFLSPSFDRDVYIIAETTVFFILFYFTTREVLQLLSHRNWVDFRDAILYDLWNHFDLATLTIIALVAFQMSLVVGDEFELDQDDYTGSSKDLRMRRLIAIAVALETIFLFHYLRILNQSLAVFITALVQIVIDLRWFIFVLGIMLSMFAQMFMVLIPGTSQGKVYAKLNCEGQLSIALFQECVNGISDFQHFYRITYEMMLGDWDLDRGFSDREVYPVFVLFTFLITIIMTNMLIAIASGSYENAKQKGPGLFRIMRIHYCSEVSLLELAMCQGSKVGSAIFISVAWFSYVVVKWLDRTINKSGSFEHQYYLYLAIGVMAWYVFTAGGVLYYTATSSKMVKERWCHKFGFEVLSLYFRNVSRFIQFVGKRWIGTIESDDDEKWDNDSG